jgi:hypothetical protein
MSQSTPLRCLGQRSGALNLQTCVTVGAASSAAWPRIADSANGHFRRHAAGGAPQRGFLACRSRRQRSQNHLPRLAVRIMLAVYVHVVHVDCEI